MTSTDSRPVGDGVLLVANAASGASVGRPDRLPDIRRRLPGARLRELGEASLDDIVAAALAEDTPPRVLAVLGGDGSVARAAHLARRHGMPLLVLPGGTFNHFARSAGLEDVDVALDAFEAARIVEVAVAEVAIDGGEPVTVLNAVSLGAYPEFLAERERRSSLGKWWGGVVALRRELRDAQPIRIDRGARHARVWSVFIGVGRNDPRRVATMQRARLDDPVVDARVHHARGSRLRAMASLAFGRRTVAVLHALRLMPPASDLERFVEEVFEIDVRPSGAPGMWVHDGELEQAPANGFRMRVRAVPEGLRIYAPPSGPATGA